MTVPCGQCMPCRINKGRLWSGRIMLEWLFHPFEGLPMFVTLTYNEKSVPIESGDDGAPVHTLKKKRFLKWVNNVQRNVGSFRYYAVGEYGDDTFRPHYHMAIFPRTNQQIPEIMSLWKDAFGFVTVGEMDAKRARYLANYTTKKLTKDSDERLQTNQEPEFRTSSRRPPLGSRSVDFLCAPYRTGDGRSILEERGDVERTFRFDGKVYPLDAFILRKMRGELGIPLLHRERIEANPNYLEFHASQEAIFDGAIATHLDNEVMHEIQRRRYYGYQRV